MHASDHGAGGKAGADTDSNNSLPSKLYKEKLYTIFTKSVGSQQKT